MNLLAQCIEKSDENNVYEDFLSNHSYSWITSQKQWSQVLTKSFKHIQEHSILIRNTRNECIDGVLPLYCVKSAFLGNRLVSIPFATLSDPLLSSREELVTLQPKLIELLRATQSKRIEIHNAFNNTIPFNEIGFKKNTEYKCHQLFLDKPIDTIYKNFHRTCIRQNISRAEKSGVSVRLITDSKDIQVFYRLYEKTRKDLLLPAIPVSFFKSIWNLYAPRNQVFFMIAEIKKEAIASMMLFNYHNRVSAEAMGWNTAYTYARPVAYIYWEAIKKAIQDGCVVFDFGRTDSSNKSLLDFKRHWGTVEFDLNTYCYPISNYKSVQKDTSLIKSLRAVIFKFPIPIYRIISKIMYNHLG